MLVLTRKEHERIIIGDGIRLTVVEVRHGKVKLGIECDAAIPVHRQEVYDRLRAEAAHALAEGAAQRG